MPKSTAMPEGGASPMRPGTRAALLPAQAGPTLVLVLLAPVVPGIAAYFGPGGEKAAQQVVTFPFLGLMVGSLLSGLAIRTFGLRLLVQLSFAGWVLCGAIGLAAGGLPMLLLGSGLLGLCTALFTSSLAAATAILFDGAARARMVGLQSAAAHLIGVAMSLASAALAGNFGWRTPFGAMLVYGAVLLALTSLHMPAFPRGGSHDRLPLRTVLARIWPVCLAGATVFVLATNQSTHLPFLLAEHGLTSATLRSLVTIATPSAGVLGALAFSVAQGRLDERLMLLAAGLSCTAGWLVFWQWHGGLVLAMAGAGLIGLGMGVFMPAIFTRLMRAVPGEASGMAMGILNAAIFLGSFSNPVLSAPLREAAGLSGMMLWLAAATAVAAVIAVLSQRPATQA